MPPNQMHCIPCSRCDPNAHTFHINSSMMSRTHTNSQVITRQRERGRIRPAFTTRVQTAAGLHTARLRQYDGVHARSCVLAFSVRTPHHNARRRVLHSCARIENACARLCLCALADCIIIIDEFAKLHAHALCALPSGTLDKRRVPHIYSVDRVR